MLVRRLWLLLAMAAFSPPAIAETAKPNIVLLFVDNLGYGEFGSYGGGVTRGTPTPRLDALAGEGTRLTNFNVELSCMPSRSAMMTGRHPVRDGTYSVPVDGKPYGLVPCGITLPKLLSKAGYGTAMYGKWRLGDSDGRYPSDLGFDEWYGIPNSSDEAIWPQDTLKWRNYKKRLVWQERECDPAERLPVPRLIELYDNPQERNEEPTGESTIVTDGWVAHAMFAYLTQFQASEKKYPPIPPGAPDDYSPKKATSP